MKKPFFTKKRWNLEARKGDSLGIGANFYGDPGHWSIVDLKKMKIKVQSFYLDKGRGYKKFRLKGKIGGFKENGNISMHLTCEEMSHDFIKIFISVEKNTKKEWQLHKLNIYIRTVKEMEGSKNDSKNNQRARR